MMKTTLLNCLLLTFSTSVCLAQEAEPGANGGPDENLPFMGTGSQLNWVTEGSGKLGEWATIEIPDGIGFLNGSDTSKLMQLYGNLAGEYEGAMAREDLAWTVIFQFAEEGYVKDDEKDKLDAGKLLKTLKEGQEYGNEEREKMGLERLEIEGWAVEPKYNETTNNLEWGTVIRAEDGSKTVNYETRLLGRNGFMNVTLLCDPDALQTVMPTYQGLLGGFAYAPGKKYAEYRKGDKVAEYGLTALVAGGATYAAVKTGLFGVILGFAKKLWYVVVAAVVAVWSGIKRFFRRITGEKV